MENLFVDLHPQAVTGAVTCLFWHHIKVQHVAKVETDY
jgi:hypothetical protein